MTATSSRIHVVAEGVLASYIHDLTARPRRAEVTKPAPRAAAEEDSGGDPG
jgi:hypothetical protein